MLHKSTRYKQTTLLNSAWRSWLQKTSNGIQHKEILTGESFWIRSWATWTRFLSSWRHFWNFLLSSSSRRSKSMAASSKAWIKPFQDFRAGTWGATAALMPVPMTSTSSRGFLVFKLGSSFLKKQHMRTEIPKGQEAPGKTVWPKVVRYAGPSATTLTHVKTTNTSLWHFSKVA